MTLSVYYGVALRQSYFAIDNQFYA